MLEAHQQNIWVRNFPVLLNSRVINAFYNFPSNVDRKYSKLISNVTTQKWNKVLKTLTINGGSWANEEGRVINRIDLKLIAKAWIKILKSRLC